MRHTKQARVLVPLLALALGAAACGSDDDEPTSNATSGAPTASATASGEAKQGGTLKVIGEEDFSHYDTAPAYDTNTYHLVRATDRQLYTNLSGDAETRAPMQPDLADLAPEERD